MDKMKHEFSYFGPWVLKIKDEHDLNHQFMHVKDELLGSRMALKIPVDKEKCCLKEGMVLYDKAIALTDQGVTLYRILDGAVFSSTIRFGDILSIKLKENMLICAIEIESALVKLSFDFVGVSAQLLKKFVRLVEEESPLAVG